MVYRSFDEILEKVKLKPVMSRVAVVGAANDHVLESVFEAESMGIVKPVLIGDTDTIKSLMSSMGANSEDYKLVQADSSEECGQIAVALIQQGEADFIMKGLAESKDVLKPIVNKDNNLHTGRTMSHVAIDQAPCFNRLTILTDGGMIPHPSLEEKRDILINAVEVLRHIGYERPRVAVLCGVEKANPKMPETMDAEALTRMAKEGIIKDCDVVGPISYDLVVDPEAARIKGFECEFTGEFDIMLVPSMAAGNMLNKCLTLSCGGKMAGVIVGAKIPVVLTSRGSSSEEKLLSLAVASLMLK